MTIYYLDSSVALHALLAGRSATARWLEARLDDGDRLVSSRLLRTEVVRALRREGIAARHADALLDDVGLLPLSEPVFAIAEGIRSHVRTLDAIHLATALHTQVGPTIATHDQRTADVAATLELSTYDPVG